MQDSHGTDLPYDAGEIKSILQRGRLNLDPKDLPTDASEYRQLLGSLNYPAVMSHPEISCIVSILQRHQSDPRITHRKAADKIHQYLRKHRTRCLRYTGGNVQLSAAVDSSWADDVDEAESQYGWVVMLCGGPVAWKSGLMRCTATSSTEAEYVALADLTCELVYLAGLLKEMGYPQRTTPVSEDNKGVLYFAIGEGNHVKKRHINIKYNLAQKYYGKIYYLVDTRGTDNPADLFTKPLPVAKFTEYATALLQGND